MTKIQKGGSNFMGPVLAFKYGKNLTNATPFTAGTFFLDIETGELFYDDPTATVQEH
jgi:hypothetical protein